MQEREKVLILGGGGRECVFAWSLKNPTVDVQVMPGNAGTAKFAKNIVEIDPEDVEKVTEYAVQIRPTLTVVGPEGPLAKGIVDAFNERRLPIFGPTEKAAQLETSKIWAGEFMIRHGIPAPESAFFIDSRSAKAYIENYQKSCVIKADGLTGGKGVEVCETKEQALAALEKITNKYGEKVVVQERLYGKEASVLAITDGKTVLTLLPAEDYKQIFDGDKGPMTGGMGGVCPHWDVVSPVELEDIRQKILIPTVRGMAAEGKPYKGILYAGLMKTKDGFKVLEFNCRGGDPEMQVILPLLRTPLLPVLMAAVKGYLNEIEFLQWSKKTCVGVVLSSEGYPGEPIKGREIFGVPNRVELKRDILIFQAGTKMKEGELVTSSGRVLIVNALATNKEGARQKVYSKLATLEQMEKGEIPYGKIGLLNGYYRTDIGKRGG